MKRRLFLSFLAALAVSWAAEPVRYIVELSGEPAIVSPERERGRRLATIGQEQADVERAVRSRLRNASVVARLRTAVNALIVEGEEGSLAQLESLPGVKRVNQSRELKLHLDRALDLHNVKQAWKAGENRGKGRKIGIIDTGIQANHPAFKAPDWMKAPEGYPIAFTDANRALTSNKIIVARTFDTGTVADTYGHGTGTAMIAAGVEHESPRGTISGVAPDAWIGVYKVARTGSNSIPTDFLVQALDAAISDGMDVVNVSIGMLALSGFPDDISASTANRMAEYGMIVVNSAGNDGPELMSLDGSASAPLVLGVGSAQTDRPSLSPAVVLPDGNLLSALASSNVTSSSTNGEGLLVDITQFDSTSLLCTPVEAGVLEGKIPLIRRGECNFTVKLRNAYRAGAATAIVYNRPDDANPDALITMSVDDDPTIPGLFVSYTDGKSMKDAAAASTAEQPYKVTARFAVAGDPKKLSNFSSIGPTLDYTIKPDLVATGSSVYTAAQTDYPAGGLYSAAGYRTASGTSFSAPMVAGAAAVLKAARPGLDASDYRSLLVNTSRPLMVDEKTNMDVMKGGAGTLDLEASIRNSLSARPVSLSFGVQGSTLDLWKQVIVKNVSTTDRTYTLELRSANQVKPALIDSTIKLAPGEIAGPILGFTGNYEPGNYQGFVVIRDDESKIETRIPYWLAVKTGKATQISTANLPETVYANSTATFYVRLHDVSGAIIEDLKPEVTVTQGNSIVRQIVRSSYYAGHWYVDVRVGTMTTNLEITAGDVKRVLTLYPN